MLSLHSTSKITQENLEVFIDVWETQNDELMGLLQNVMNVDRTNNGEGKGALFLLLTKRERNFMSSLFSLVRRKVSGDSLFPPKITCNLW